MTGVLRSTAAGDPCPSLLPHDAARKSSGIAPTLATPLGRICPPSFRVGRTTAFWRLTGCHLTRLGVANRLPHPAAGGRKGENGAIRRPERNQELTGDRGRRRAWDSTGGWVTARRLGAGVGAGAVCVYRSSACAGGARSPSLPRAA